MDKLANLFAAPAASVYSLRDETAPVPTIAPQPSAILPSSFGQPASNISATAAADELLLFKSSKTSPEKRAIG